MVYGIKISSTQAYIFENKFKEGEVDDQGRIAHNSVTLKNGSVYTGQWLDLTIDGYGKMVCKDGSEYLGNWYQNTPHGFGKLLNANGDTYEG